MVFDTATFLSVCAPRSLSAALVLSWSDALAPEAKLTSVSESSLSSLLLLAPLSRISWWRLCLALTYSSVVISSCTKEMRFTPVVLSRTLPFGMRKCGNNGDLKRMRYPAQGVTGVADVEGADFFPVGAPSPFPYHDILRIKYTSKVDSMSASVFSLIARQSGFRCVFIPASTPKAHVTP